MNIHVWEKNDGNASQTTLQSGMILKDDMMIVCSFSLHLVCIEKIDNGTPTQQPGVI